MTQRKTSLLGKSRVSEQGGVDIRRDHVWRVCFQDYTKKFRRSHHLTQQVRRIQIGRERHDAGDADVEVREVREQAEGKVGRVCETVDVDGVVLGNDFLHYPFCVFFGLSCMNRERLPFLHCQLELLSEDSFLNILR